MALPENPKGKTNHREWMDGAQTWVNHGISTTNLNWFLVVVSKIFYLHPYLEKIPILTN